MADEESSDPDPLPNHHLSSSSRVLTGLYNLLVADTDQSDNDDETDT